MKVTKFALSTLLVCGFAGTTLAQNPTIKLEVKPATTQTNSNQVAAQSVVHTRTTAPNTTTTNNSYFAASGCDSMGNSGCASDPGCAGLPGADGNGSCGCAGMGADSCAGLGQGCQIGDCGLGEPWKLFATPCGGWNIGGWTNIGYHTANNAGGGILAPLGNPGFVPAPGNFNNYADRVQLQQQWFYAEKVADGSNGVGIGGRIDYLYGTDAPDTQSFGIANSHWDNSWDNGGAYGHAIPQLYGELAYDKWSLKAGHFFTIVGNEVVQATGNFFYSRQFTFYNAEPFTHTGLLSTYQLNECTTLWNGYVMGWDSGFEDNGDAFIGGFKRAMQSGQNLIYTTTVGRLNDDFQGRGFAERGSLHSVILSSPLTDRLTHLVQTDFMFTNDANDVGLRNTYGLINYLTYQMNERWAVGSRTEWFNFSTEFGPTPVRNADLFNQTFGFNYKPTANMVIRPEVRWVWDKERLGVNEISSNTGLPMASQMSFGTDLIWSY
jgi:Putative beta-barrel porin-2, OmpL-like. bbp2